MRKAAYKKIKPGDIVQYHFDHVSNVCPAGIDVGKFTRKLNGFLVVLDLETNVEYLVKEQDIISNNYK